MEYTILERMQVSDDTEVTKVQYNIEGNIVIVDVAHFMPTEESILLGINNRYYTEMYKIFPERLPPAPVITYDENDGTIIE